MPLIKSSNAPVSISPFSMQDIEDQARAVLLRAQQKAEQLLAQAQTAGEQLRLAAQAQGLAEGKNQGLALGRAQGLKEAKEQALNENRQKLSQLISALASASQQLDDSRRELEAAAVEDVINLAIAIAQRVTKRLGVVDSGVVIANVTEALKLVLHASDVRIAVHPTQRQSLTEALPALRLQWPSLSHVEIMDDAALAPGGCRLFTTHGIVDADLDGQLQRVCAELVPDKA